MAYPTLKHYPIATIENPQMDHHPECHFAADFPECKTMGWRGKWGYCICSGYPQVKCKYCGVVVDEVFEPPTGPEDMRDDDERLVTTHVCDKV